MSTARRVVPLLVALGAVLLVAPALAVDGVVQRASVSPDRAFTDSPGGVRIEFRLSGSAPADVTIRVSSGSTAASDTWPRLPRREGEVGAGGADVTAEGNRPPAA